MPNSKNVTTGKPAVAGAIYNAPVGTEIPKDAKTQLSEEFRELGFISEDGVTNSRSTDGDTVNAWGGTPVLQTQTSTEDSFSFTLIEATNIETLKTVYGEKNVTGTLDTGIVIKVNSDEPEEFIWVVDMIFKGGVLKRIVIPKGKVSEVGDITYNDSDPVGYETTLKCAADATGVTHYEYIQKSAA